MSHQLGLTLRLRLFLVCLWPVAGVAQQNSWSVSVPSPTAASLGKYGDIPVSLYTGIPDIRIPLFTARGKTLELPIALAYHASGIRVEELGGWVGLGWSLEAGGAITRTVRGLPDEPQYGYYNTGNSFYDNANWPVAPYEFMRNMTQDFIDGEPDQFFVTIGGRSAQFVMGPTGTSLSTQEVRTVPYQKWRIVPTLLGGISQWVVTTEDGTRYTFAAREDQRTLAPGPLHTYYTSTWYLTEIRSIGGDIITLQYQSYPVQHNLGISGERRDEATLCSTTFTQYQNDVDMTLQRLSSITAAGHQVSFTTSMRADALAPVGGTPQEPRLDQITVTAPGGSPVVRRFQFSYDYSIASPGRLTLLSVAEQDAAGVSLPPHTFTYGGPQLPARTSYAVDHWGYYNGKTQNASYVPPGRSAQTGFYYSGADRNPDSASMLAGTLTRITYPTGGFTDFTYEPHDYSWIYTGGNVTDSGPPIQTPQVFASGSGSTQTASLVIGGLDTVWVGVSVFVSMAPSCSSNCPRVEITNAAGTATVLGPWTQTGQYTTLLLAPGTYRIKATSGSYSTTVIGSMTWREWQPVTAKRAGGLRIAEIRDSDAMGGSAVRKFKYSRWADPNQSSGMIEAEPRYDYNFLAQSYYTNGNPGPSCAYYSRSFMSRMPLGGGSPVVYGEVTVWHGASAEFGKERHAFLVGDRPPETTNSGKWPFHRQTNFFWRWGQEVYSATYDAAGRIQRAVSSSYQLPADTTSYREFRGMSLVAFPNPTTPVSPGPFVNAAPFRIQAAWKYKSTETVTVYDTAGVASVATTTLFTYGNPRHAQLTQVTETNSDGKQRITRYRYPADFTVTAANDPETTALQAMQGAAHVHGAVVERLVSEKVAGNELIVQGELTTFREFGTGQYLPYQHFILNNPTPIP